MRSRKVVGKSACLPENLGRRDVLVWDGCSVAEFFDDGQDLF